VLIGLWLANVRPPLENRGLFIGKPTLLTAICANDVAAPDQAAEPSELWRMSCAQRSARHIANGCAQMPLRGAPRSGGERAQKAEARATVVRACVPEPAKIMADHY